MARDDFVDEILDVIYQPPAPDEPPNSNQGAHDLAFLFMVLTVGLQLDLSTTYTYRSEEVYQTLAKAALGLEPLVNGCSLALVQTLNVMIYRYVFFVLCFWGWE
jgi:hypothetical protein